MRIWDLREPFCGAWFAVTLFWLFHSSDALLDRRVIWWWERLGQRRCRQCEEQGEQSLLTINVRNRVSNPFLGSEAACRCGMGSRVLASLWLLALLSICGTVKHHLSNVRLRNYFLSIKKASLPLPHKGHDNIQDDMNMSAMITWLMEFIATIIFFTHDQRHFIAMIQNIILWTTAVHS